MQYLNISKNTASLEQTNCTRGLALRDNQLCLASIRFVLDGESPLFQGGRESDNAGQGYHLMPQIYTDLLTISGDIRSDTMEGDTPRGHICFCFFGLSVELCVCFLLWQWSHDDKNISGSARWGDLLTQWLFAYATPAFFDNWLDGEKWPLHDTTCMCVCSSAKVQACTKDFLTPF